MILCVRGLLVVALLCGVARASDSMRRSLDTDLDSVLCSSTKTFTGKIIDIHESMDRGAELLNGMVSESLELCSSGCCKTERCDMVLYKNHGFSKSGNNCYHVNCGEVGNCVLVEHSSFTSIIFHPASTPEEDHIPKEDHTPKEDHPSASPASSVSVPNQATPTHTNARPLPATTPLPKSPPSAGSSANHTSSKIAVSPTEEPTSDGKKKGSSGSQVVATPDGQKRRTVDDGECGRYGCDGSGIVAVVVVAVICFAIVLVVIAILLKKVVNERRRRRFKNVDYLINGMYT